MTLVDLAVSHWLPEVRAVWGLYLNLLAFCPLVLLFPLDNSPSTDLGTELTLALQSGFWMTILFVVTALLREGFGLGSHHPGSGGRGLEDPGSGECAVDHRGHRGRRFSFWRPAESSFTGSSGPGCRPGKTSETSRKPPSRHPCRRLRLLRCRRSRLPTLSPSSGGPAARRGRNPSPRVVRGLGRNAHQRRRRASVVRNQGKTPHPHHRVGKRRAGVLPSHALPRPDQIRQGLQVPSSRRRPLLDQSRDGHPGPVPRPSN